jgi:hypothetical protein
LPLFDDYVKYFTIISGKEKMRSGLLPNQQAGPFSVRASIWSGFLAIDPGLQCGRAAAAHMATALVAHTGQAVPSSADPAPTEIDQ